jgi:hypothetical protein
MKNAKECENEARALIAEASPVRRQPPSWVKWFSMKDLSAHQTEKKANL